MNVSFKARNSRADADIKHVYNLQNLYGCLLRMTTYKLIETIFRFRLFKQKVKKCYKNACEFVNLQTDKITFNLKEK